VRVPSQRHRWPWAFTTAMMWLAVFSYIMCAAADGLHDGFGISQAVLGVTICAVGTSFPNFWASLLMAKAGRADMAIANALGSNVQNVFLALAIPWLMRICTQDYKPFPVSGKGIFTGVMWMAGTELFVFVMAVVGGWQMGKSTGYACIVLYLAYVAVATHIVDHIPGYSQAVAALR
jgi:Ca2+/Na+ antiporter